jgi:beta-glucosidase
MRRAQLQHEDGATAGETPWENNAQVSERCMEAAERDDYIVLQTDTRVRYGPEGVRGPGLPSR